MAYLLSSIISLTIGFIGVYFFNPVFSYDFSGWFFLVILMVAPFAMIIGISESNNRNRNRRGAWPLFGALISVSVCFFVVAALLTSLPMIRAKSYRNLIGNVEVSRDHSLPPIDINNAPLVSKNMAFQVAQKKLSEVPSLGSQVQLGELVKQSINGKLYWVAFLEHSGFFQWTNRKVTPGYVKVSASDSNEVEFVTKLNGEDLKIKYLESAYFGDNAHRRIYFDGSKTLGISEMIPEIDDSGRPYLVASLYEKTIGISGKEVVKTAVLDVQTGEIKLYSVADTPTWVDRIHPSFFISEQVVDWGYYINGWFNPSQQDRMTISGAVDLVYGVDGECYFYMGISSVGKENAIAGFMLVNSRNKKAKIYYHAGAREDVAQQTAADVMPEKRYYATNPLAFSVNGVPTYIMTLTDHNGIPRAYGMVNMSNHLTLAVSETLTSTYRMYLNRLSRSPQDISIEKDAENNISLTGKVLRIATEIKNGNTVYYITIVGSDHIFTANSDISEKIVLTKPDDNISVRYEKTQNKVASLNFFENKEIK